MATVALKEYGHHIGGEFVPAASGATFESINPATAEPNYRAARGELIMHWDDDDWMAPWRISYQLSELQRTGAEACGLRRMLFYEPASRQAWLYDYPENQRPWLAGGSLLYRRTFWERAPFPDLQVGSDTYFVWNQPLDHAVALPDFSFYVAIVHANNTSPKELTGPYWSAWTSDLRAIMGDDLDSFDARPAQPLPPPEPPACDILMVAHNACQEDTDEDG